ncbi:HNH endonuclease signature motif containing protein [[Micrococcus luteus] ATCC 49442]|uniref:HNH endonuclease signature motif containing protein n=1 Tax=[Micrococcus luteus] ATCC 49442 TaxID=2698727 RepID=UPI0013D92E1A|nr:HNH endonuclease signature motif containing protein [[Micrococcus luteus] ATCC 49442]
MDNAAGAEVLEAIAASALRLAGVLRGAVDIFTGGDLAGSPVPVGVPATCPRAGVADIPPVSTAGGPADGPVPGAFAAGPFAAGSDPLRWQAEACLTVLSGAAGLEAMVAAVKVHAAGGYDEAAQVIAGPIMSPQEQTAQDMSIVAEVACALTVSERTAGGLLGEAHRLTTALPLTLAALQAGTLSWQHARIMVDETTNLEPAAAHALEAHFLDPDAPNPARGAAGGMVPGRFRAKARTWRERHHPVSIEQRHTRSALDRRVEFCPDRDGMAWLSAYLPADQAAGIWNRATTAARALQGPTEGRTLTQLRADNVAAWLLGGTLHSTQHATQGGTLDGAAGRIPSPAAQVLVTVPVFALMGLTDEPAILDGYGPIPPSMARALVANGAESFRRVLTDPRDGAPLEIGRESYRIPKALRQWLRLRDGKCQFPGCSNPSLDNEADHLKDWANGGSTGISNLAQLCPKHHRLKHARPWQPTEATKDEPPGWISPTGRHYQSEQPDQEPPHWPGAAIDSGQGFPVDPWALSNDQPPRAPVPRE